MKIFELRDSDYYNWAAEQDTFVNSNPFNKAMFLLREALETVNQAGLDGKKLSDLTIVYHPGTRGLLNDGVTEIHAKVTHRLRQPVTA